MTSTRQTVLGVLQRFKQPEYTGENRCLPCTILNTAIAVVLSGAVALVSIPAALLVFAACLVAIAFRGYLVPGTPTLVQYLPDRVHEAIGGHHELPDEEVASGEQLDVERTLTSAGIVRECDEVDDLCLTDDYREAFRDQVDRLQDEHLQRERLSATLSVSPDEVRFEEHDGSFHVFVDDVRAGGWRSRAAFIADLASEHLLSTWLDRDWEALPAPDRTQLLVALRTFVETCPDCGGDVVPDEDVVRSCCRDDIVSVTTACVDCDAVVFKGTER